MESVCECLRVGCDCLVHLDNYDRLIVTIDVCLIMIFKYNAVIMQLLQSIIHILT